MPEADMQEWRVCCFIVFSQTHVKNPAEECVRISSGREVYDIEGSNFGDAAFD